MRPGGRSGGEHFFFVSVRIRAHLKGRAGGREGREESETEGGKGTKTGKVDM